MKKEDKQAVIQHLASALEILRRDGEASAQSGGTGSGGGPPEDDGGD